MKVENMKRYNIKDRSALFLIVCGIIMLTACAGVSGGGGGGNVVPNEDLGKDATRQLIGRKLDTHTTLLRRAACYPLADLAATVAAEAAAAAAVSAAASTLVGALFSPLIAKLVGYLTYIAVYAPTQVVCLHTLNQAFGSVAGGSGKRKMQRELENCIYRESEDTIESINSTQVQEIVGKRKKLEESADKPQLVLNRISALYEAIAEWIIFVVALAKEGIVDKSFEKCQKIVMEDTTMMMSLSDTYMNASYMFNGTMGMEMFNRMNQTAQEVYVNLTASDEQVRYSVGFNVTAQLTDTYYVVNATNKLAAHSTYSEGNRTYFLRADECARKGYNCTNIDPANIVSLMDIASDLGGSYILTEDISINVTNWQPIGNFSHPFVGHLHGNKCAINALGTFPEKDIGMPNNLNVTVADRTIRGKGIFGVINYAEITDLEILSDDCPSQNENLTYGLLSVASIYSTIDGLNVNDDDCRLIGVKYGESTIDPVRASSTCNRTSGSGISIDSSAPIRIESLSAVEIPEDIPLDENGASNNSSSARPVAPCPDGGINTINITNTADLENQLNMGTMNTNTYCLQSDLVINSTWRSRDLAGSFYGRGYTISVEGNYSIPVFHTISKTGTVTQLVVKDGAIAVVNMGNISSVRSSGNGGVLLLANNHPYCPSSTQSINTRDQIFGGLVAYNQGTLEKSVSSDINASWDTDRYRGYCSDSGMIDPIQRFRAFPRYVGGLVGRNAVGGIIDKSRLRDSNINIGKTIGGLAGHNTGVIRNSYVSSTTLSGGTTVGGLVGVNSNTGFGKKGINFSSGTIYYSCSINPDIDGDLKGSIAGVNALGLIIKASCSSDNNVLPLIGRSRGLQ